jgi:phosphatidate cytidylyltransferase
MNNLALRVVTAVVLIAALLLLLFKAGSTIFAAALYVFGLLAVWELWRLVQPNNKSALWVMGLVYSGVAVQLWVLPSIPVLLGVGMLHVVVTVCVLRFKPALQTILTGLYGAVLLACVMVSMTVLQSFGAWVLITAMVVVWAADVGGYFFGKGLGGKFFKHGLAPQISPKKSWEGAIGGVLLAVLVTACTAYYAAHVPRSGFSTWVLPNWLLAKFELDITFFNPVLHPILFSIIVIIAAYSVTGDLLESLLKRQAGVKDSSQLLPGHGGILDRIDALIPVLPLCAACAYFVGYRA